MLNEISQTEKDKYHMISLTCRIFLKNENWLIDTKNRLVVARGRERGVGKRGEGGQNVQNSGYKINKS